MEKLYTKKAGFSVMFAILVFIVCGVFAVQPIDPGAIAQQKVKPYLMEDGDWNFWTNAPDMYTVPSGNVGIGTTTPTVKLEVVGDVAVSGQITSGVASGTAPVCVNSTTACPNLNADMLDGHSSDEFARKAEFHFSAGGQSHIIEIPHHRVCQLIIGEGYGAPDEVAFVNIMENDGQIAYIGFDGAGSMVKGTASLYSVNTILTLKGGNWVLETYGTNPPRLKLTSAFEDGDCMRTASKM